LLFSKAIIVKVYLSIFHNLYSHTALRGRHGHDCMVVGFATTYVISVNHHKSCEFESRSCRGCIRYNIMW